MVLSSGHRRQTSELQKRHMRIAISALLIAWTLILAMGALEIGPMGTVSAQTFGYTFDEYGRRAPSPQGYVREAVISCLELGCGQLRGPRDLMIDRDGYLYIVDTGNDRVLKASPQYDEILLELTSAGGVRLRLPQGLYVDEQGNILVADTGNERLVLYDASGNVLEIFERPESNLLPPGFYYQPIKVVMDRSGFIYVVNQGDFEGLLRLDRQGRFRGFFAPIHVGFDIRRTLTRLLLTREQRDRMKIDLPPSHSNITISQDGFIYTTAAQASVGQIMRLNAVGENTYPENFYGEPSRTWQWSIPHFVDLAVSERGIISALESNTGNIYQYDEEGHLLMVFGGIGDSGWFLSPAAIEIDDKNQLYVLDSARADIQVFRPTEFTSLIHEATELYYLGEYEKAAEPWEQVLRLNSNFARAHQALGKVAMKREDWVGAMRHYRLANDRDGYGEAYAQYRHEYSVVRFFHATLWVFGGIVVVWLVYRIVRALVKRATPESGLFLRTLRAAVLILKEPSEVFLELKSGRYLGPGLLMLGCFYLVRVLSIMTTSFHYSSVDPNRTSMLLEAVYLFVPLLTWVVAHYAVSTVTEGKGFIRDFLIGTAFSLSPYILFSVPVALLTNVMAPGERMYYTTMNAAIVIWCVILFLHQIRVINEFSYRKAIGSGLVSIFAILLSWGMLGLVYGVGMEMVRFVREILLEIALRG